MNPFTFNLMARLAWLLSFGQVRISATLRNPKTGEVRKVGIRPRATHQTEDK